MAPNKRKMLEAARKYAQKGAKDRALKEYEQLLRLDPRDAKLRLEVGDAHRRWGQVDEAMATYRRVAEQYTAEGFDARAVAVYKQIQALDPKGHAACEPLAELYQRMGLQSEAVAALQAAADGHARDGSKRHALELLRRMVGLDPTNTTSRIKVADLLRQERLLEEAAAEYEGACAELERQGETEAAGRVIERLLELAPDRVDVLGRLARNLLARGKVDEAEAPARRAAEREPQEIAHHELLAEIYAARKRDDRLVETYRKIAELYRARGDEQQARVILQRFVPVSAFEAPVPRGGAAAREPSFGSDDLDLDGVGASGDLLDDEVFLDDPAPVTRRALPAQPPRGPAARPPAPPGARPAPARAAAARAPTPPRASAGDTVFELGAEEGSRILGDPEQLLAEASVYLRYGKRAQAIENLQAILARDPRHRAALEKLGDAYADDGDAAGAVAAWLRAGELARDAGDLEAMGVLRDRVAALDAAAAATLESDDAELETDDDYLDVDVDAGEPREEAALPDEAPDEIEIDIDDSEADAAGDAFAVGGPEPAPPERDGEELEIELDLDAGEPPPATSAEPVPSLPEQISEDLEEAEFYLQQGLVAEARALFDRVLAGSPGHPLALLRLGELAAAAGLDPDAPGGETEPVDRSATPLVGGAAQQPLAEETEPEADRAWLGGEDDPFPDAPDASAPGATADPFLEDDEAPLGGEPAGAEVEPAPPPGPPAGDAFDLAAELSADLDPAQPGGAQRGVAGDDGFRALFGAFKRGVQRALGSHDHEAHYDLGIAYREMGLFDDAASEFRSAMASPARRIDCLHMLGLCALEQDRPDEAVDYLSHALSAPDLERDRELAIRFELGRAYERGGDAEKARAAWEKVASVDPEFCEVGELLATLGERSALPAAEFESFGDLLAEVEERPEPEAASRHEPFEDLLDAVPVDRESEASEAPERGRADGAPQPTPAPGRPRRRKISFV